MGMWWKWQTRQSQKLVRKSEGSSPSVPIQNFRKKEEKDMITLEQKLALMKNRLATLTENGKNVKSPGVVRKLQRTIRNMEQNL